MAAEQGPRHCAKARWQAALTMYSLRTSQSPRLGNCMRMLGAFVLLSLAVQTASAVTLTFDSQATMTVVTGLDEQGFRVTGIGENHYVSSGGTAFCMPACAYNGSNHILAFDAAFEIVPVSGQPFSILGLDIAESQQGMQEYWAQTVRVTGTFIDNSTVSIDLLLDFAIDGEGPLGDFQTELLPSTFSNLTSVRIEGFGGLWRSGFAVDNILVSDKPTVKAAAELAEQTVRSVPEPSTVALVVLALVGLRIATQGRGRKAMVQSV